MTLHTFMPVSLSVSLFRSAETCHPKEQPPYLGCLLLHVPDLGASSECRLAGPLRDLLRQKLGMRQGPVLESHSRDSQWGVSVILNLGSTEILCQGTEMLNIA